MKPVRLLAAAIAAAAVLSMTACTIDPTFGAGSSGSGSNSGSSDGDGSGSDAAGSDAAGGAELPDPSALEEALEDAFDTSGSGDGSGGSGGSDPGSGEQAEPVLDACMLITDDEITDIVGPHSGGQLATAAGVPDPDGSWCTYENPENYHSVTIRLGDRNTVVGNELPEISDYGTTEPGPDGIRFASGGVAEFVLDTRLCDVQVVTDPTDDTADHRTAVRLIGLIRERA